MRVFLSLSLVLMLLGCGNPPATGGPPSSGHAEEAGHAHEHEAEEGGEAGHEEHDHAAEGEAGHQEGEEGLVTLTDAQAREIGLKTAPLGTMQGAPTALRTGRVEADPDRKVIVSTQVAGTVRDLPVIMGSRIGRGDLVAVVHSPEVTVLKGEYHNAEIEADLAAKELTNKRELIAVGDESRREVEEAGLELAKAQASRDGAAAKLESAQLTYGRMEKLRSEGIASAQQVEQALAERKTLEAELREAKTGVTIASQHLQREKRVAASQLREKAETFPAEANLTRAEESVKHAAERLRQLGAEPEENEGIVHLRSPIDGQVVERPATRGQVLDAGDPIAVLVDPSEVWVWVDLIRADLATVDVGEEVTVSLVSDPEVTATGEISHIDAQVNSETQTVRARIVLREGVGRFRVGSFVNAALSAQGVTEPTVPQEAIVEVEGEKVVYRLDGKGFRRTPVRIVSSGKTTASVSGIPQGSQIVVKGATDLKSIDLAGTIGGHQH